MNMTYLFVLAKALKTRVSVCQTVNECAETSDFVQVQSNFKETSSESERRPQVQRSWSGEQLLMFLKHFMGNFQVNKVNYFKKREKAPTLKVMAQF